VTGGPFQSALGDRIARFFSQPGPNADLSNRTKSSPTLSVFATCIAIHHIEAGIVSAPGAGDDPFPAKINSGTDYMRRREFITLLGSAATAWPLAARAQLDGRVRRIGVLMLAAATAPEAQSNMATFVQGLRKLGWIDGQNLQLEVRWSAGDMNIAQAYATDLVGLFKPDVLLVSSTANLVALQRATGTIPIVFTGVSDPVEQGFVPNLNRPGGNITGFVRYEFSIAGKWADLLKQMVPSLARVALIFDPEASPQNRLFLSTLEAVAPSLGVEVTAAPLRSTSEFETAIARLSGEPNVGLIFSGAAFSAWFNTRIVETVAQHRLPAIYASDVFTTEGGLMSYFSDPSEPYRLAPFYVDRILKGTKPGDLPVQLPTRFKFIVNRKTASALGIEVPLGILLAADEVIE
jgi:putative tryptophan/tyrosine transport system substrate-binding protein